MPLLTRIFLFSAFAWLLLSLGLETAANAARAGLMVSSPVSGVTTLHGIVFGWITQMIFGVAWWMFPPASRQNARPLGSLAWISYGVLNCGLILRFLFESWHADGRAWYLVISAALQSAAFFCFALTILPRIKAR